MKRLEGPGWVRRIAETLLLLLTIAWVAHWVYELLRPLIPTLVTGLVLVLLVTLLLRRRRW
jgi:putative effector of murein hydrolase LrgA (UPF0299 family)